MPDRVAARERKSGCAEIAAALNCELNTRMMRRAAPPGSRIADKDAGCWSKGVQVARARRGGRRPEGLTCRPSPGDPKRARKRPIVDHFTLMEKTMAQGIFLKNKS